MLRNVPPPPGLPEDFAPPLADPNSDGRQAVLRGLTVGCGVSSVLWVVMFYAWREWGWWAPPAVLLGSSLVLVALVLAFRRRSR